MVFLLCGNWNFYHRVGGIFKLGMWNFDLGATYIFIVAQVVFLPGVHGIFIVE